MPTTPDRPPRLAVLVGAEGSGLTEGARRAVSHRVRIPMAPGVDSLNVATALAIALHRLFPDPAASHRWSVEEAGRWSG
jgi:tRNA G18 (ribose-2'-O)-methylase SpoU